MEINLSFSKEQNIWKYSFKNVLSDFPTAVYANDGRGECGLARRWLFSQTDGLFRISAPGFFSLVVFLLKAQRRYVACCFMKIFSFTAWISVLLSNATLKIFAKNKTEMFKETQICEPFSSEAFKGPGKGLTVLFCIFVNKSDLEGYFRVLIIFG